jgi:hypothetical protein
MTIRDSFVEHFGEEDAGRIEEASIGHQNDDKVNHGNDRWGKDPFKYHLLMCISHECFSEFHEWHGIKADAAAMKAWALEHADLHEYEGDIPDYIGMIAGAYTSWINWEKAGDTPPDDPDAFERNLAEWRAMPPEERLATMQKLASEAMQLLAHHFTEKGPSNE